MLKGNVGTGYILSMMSSLVGQSTIILGVQMMSSPLNFSSTVGGGGSTFEDAYGTSVPEGANVSQGAISGNGQGASTSAAPGGGGSQAPPMSSFQEAESSSQASAQFVQRSHEQAAAMNQQTMAQELQQQQQSQLQQQSMQHHR